MYSISKQNDRKQIINIVNVHRKTDWKKRLIWGVIELSLIFFFFFLFPIFSKFWGKEHFVMGKKIF